MVHESTDEPEKNKGGYITDTELLDAADWLVKELFRAIIPRHINSARDILLSLGQSFGYFRRYARLEKYRELYEDDKEGGE